MGQKRTVGKRQKNYEHRDSVRVPPKSCASLGVSCSSPSIKGNEVPGLFLMLDRRPDVREGTQKETVRRRK